ncbi:hypothetical protein [Pseudomonas sp. NPDC096950]|uniref:hypothetical protein n=1 Tax=Pseudomonas sp. NPDC096950 TaxID=3364485 RepID=UPI00383AA7C5
MTNTLEAVSLCVTELNNQISTGWGMVALGAPQDVQDLCSMLGIDLEREMSERALHGLRVRRDIYLDALYLLTEEHRQEIGGGLLDDLTAVSILRQHGSRLDLQVGQWAELDRAELAHIHDIELGAAASSVVSTLCHLVPGYASEHEPVTSNKSHDWPGIVKRLSARDLLSVLDITSAVPDADLEPLWLDLVNWGTKPVVVRIHTDGRATVQRAQYGIPAHKLMADMGNGIRRRGARGSDDGRANN